MAKTLGILVIHGMGTADPQYGNGMIAEIERRTGAADQLAWGVVHWSEVLSGRQAAYLARANVNSELDFPSLRRFVVSALGDAAAYRRTDDDPRSTYGEIHSRIQACMKELREQLERDDSPLVILAHSLGGHIMSNSIWDIQEGMSIVPLGDGAFERMQTLRLMVTFGCNIPLFVAAHREVRPITLPEDARWINFLTRTMFLGFR